MVVKKKAGVTGQVSGVRKNVGDDAEARVFGL